MTAVVGINDLDAIVSDVMDAVRQARVLRDAAYRLAVLSLQSDRYASEPDFREATDNVLHHFGATPRKD